MNWEISYVNCSQVIFVSHVNLSHIINDSNNREKTSDTYMQTWGQFNSGTDDYLKKNELELINFELELKFPTNKFNPQFNLLLNFLIQKYFFHGNPTWNINYSE